MKNIQTTRWSLVFFLFFMVLIIATSTQAQVSSGGAYSVTQKVIAGGGATSSGGSLELSGTIGQHDTGTSSGGAFVLEGGFWPEETFTTPPPVCAVDVTSQLNITRGGFSYNFVTRRFRQTVTIRNDGALAITGPLAYTLDGLSPNATLIDPAGTTSCAAPSASPYVIVATSNSNQIAPSEVVSVTLEYTNSNTRQSITYTPRVLAGGIR